MERQRLARCLLFSLAIHGTLSAYFNAPQSTQHALPEPLRLTWRDQRPADRLTAEKSARAYTAQDKVRITPRGARQKTMTALSPAPAAPLQKEAEILAAPSTQGLLENAKQLAREEGRKMEQQASKTKSYPDRQNHSDSSENRLAQALQVAGRQEKALRSGMTRITAASGATYCLTAPVDLQAGGLNDTLRVASSCP